MKKVLVAAAISLLVGCSDSQTSTAESSTPDSTPTTTPGDDGTGGSEPSTPSETPSEAETETVPADPLVRFSGEDFGYLRINTSFYGTSEEVDEYTVDPREAYDSWHYSYVEAHALLEAMHAINAYRDDNQQITSTNGGSQNVDSLISNYCPTSGASFAADRCAFYAQLAHSKTMAQDGWQVEHRLNRHSSLICGPYTLKFFDCSYSLLGNNGRSTSYDWDDLETTNQSPIEGWQYEQNAAKIIASNQAVVSYVSCALGADYGANELLQRRAALSPWPEDSRDWDTQLTQYGTLVVWIFSNDTVEDVYTDVVAEHSGSSASDSAFRSDLKAIQPSANL